MNESYLYKIVVRRSYDNGQTWTDWYDYVSNNNNGVYHSAASVKKALRYLSARSWGQRLQSRVFITKLDWKETDVDA